MKKFIEVLSDADESMRFNDYRVFPSINAGKYRLSIQGSNGHYCTPREIVPVSEYISMEMAIFRGEKWIRPYKSSTFRAFPRYRELMRCIDSTSISNPVFGYVSVDLIEDLYQYLCEK